MKVKRHKQIKQNENLHKAFMDLATICIQLLQTETGEHVIEPHNIIINSNSSDNNVYLHQKQFEFFDNNLAQTADLIRNL